jgi:hypothetical protein
MEFLKDIGYELDTVEVQDPFMFEQRSMGFFNRFPWQSRTTPSGTKLYFLLGDMNTWIAA